MANNEKNCMSNFTVRHIHPKQTDGMMQRAKQALYHVFKKYK